MLSRARHLLLAGLACLLPALGAVENRPLIIDHSCTDLAKVPAASLTKAGETIRLAYGHTSHGSQIVAAMAALMQSDRDRFGYSPQPGRGLQLLNCTPQGDLGNPDRRTWAQRTRELLQGPGKDLNLIMWSWCGQAGTASEQDIQIYLDLMSGLEREFPAVTFIYMTGHLDGSGAKGNLNLRNEQIRAFCRAEGKVLFDFADIESFDPEGTVNYLALNGRDSCDYTVDGATRNWADDWLAAHPDHGFVLPKSAAHSRPLNGALKGRAFWWMMARLAGWNGK